MSNGKSESDAWQRWFNVKSKVNMMILDKKRHPEKVALYLAELAGYAFPDYVIPKRLEMLYSEIGAAINRGSMMLGQAANHLQSIIDDAERFDMRKFALLIDLGLIKVPKGFKSRSCLKDFRNRKINRDRITLISSYLDDAYFYRPSKILRPGQIFRVRVFAPVVSEPSSSEERMNFLTNEGAIFTGAQGAALVIEQKYDELPRRKLYASFDRPSRLWRQYPSSDRQVPILTLQTCDSYFSLHNWGDCWPEYGAFFCFTEPTSEEIAAEEAKEKE